MPVALTGLFVPTFLLSYVPDLLPVSIVSVSPATMPETVAEAKLKFAVPVRSPSYSLVSEAPVIVTSLAVMMPVVSKGWAVRL